ncbi:MAG: Rid family detoxifying hydrolase [Anaerolineales bacterium]|nr:Rid family detoxifying hydrolase [Anaerolineales bacterium]
MKQIVQTPYAPAPKGAYSQGVITAAPQLYIAAQGPFDPATGAVVGTTFQAQAERVFTNIQAIVTAAGATMADVVKVTVYLADAAYFAEMNAIYQRFFPEPYPARTPVLAPVYLALIMADAVVALPEG